MIESIKTDMNKFRTYYHLSIAVLIVTICFGTFALCSSLSQEEQRIYYFESIEEYEDTGNNLSVIIEFHADRGFRWGENAKVNNTNIFIRGEGSKKDKLEDNIHLPVLLPLEPDAAEDGSFIPLAEIYQTEDGEIIFSENREEIELTPALHFDLMLIEYDKEDIVSADQTDLRYEQPAYQFERTERIEVRRPFLSTFILGLIAVMSLSFAAVSGISSLKELRK